MDYGKLSKIADAKPKSNPIEDPQERSESINTEFQNFLDSLVAKQCKFVAADFYEDSSWVIFVDGPHPIDLAIVEEGNPIKVNVNESWKSELNEALSDYDKEQIENWYGTKRPMSVVSKVQKALAVLVPDKIQERYNQIVAFYTPKEEIAEPVNIPPKWKGDYESFIEVLAKASGIWKDEDPGIYASQGRDFQGTHISSILVNWDTNGKEHLEKFEQWIKDNGYAKRVFGPTGSADGVWKVSNDSYMLFWNVVDWEDWESGEVSPDHFKWKF